MYIPFSPSPISTGMAMYTGEHAPHKNPSPKKKKKRNVHTQMLHVVNRNRKNIPNKKEKKDQNDSAIRGGIY